MTGNSPIVELRQYTLKPGMRDTLIGLFEREFVETQESAGIDLIGQFRDADDADRFVWLRGFDGLESRALSLKAFYGGPVWKSHRDAANATMIDSSNVLLLKPAWRGSGFSHGSERAPRGATAQPPGVVTISICWLAAPATEAFIAACRGELVVQCEESGAMPLGAFVTEPSANNFPALPIRQDENVFVWGALFDDATAVRTIILPPYLAATLSKPIETRRLLPTARSRLHV